MNDRKMDNLKDFDDEAKKAMDLATKIAKEMRSRCVDTEHILLALIKMEKSLASRALKSLGVDLVKVKSLVQELCTSACDDCYIESKILSTPGVRRVIRYAKGQARESRYKLVGTGDLLVGLIMYGEGIAGTVLTQDFKLSVKKVLNEILFMPE